MNCSERLSTSSGGRNFVAQQNKINSMKVNKLSVVNIIRNTSSIPFTTTKLLNSVKNCKTNFTSKTVLTA